MFTHCSFDTTKNKFHYYRGKDCTKNFCRDLREHATKITNYEKKEMIPLTKKEEKMHNEQEKKDALMIALMMAKKYTLK